MIGSDNDPYKGARSLYSYGHCTKEFWKQIEKDVENRRKQHIEEDTVESLWPRMFKNDKEIDDEEAFKECFDRRCRRPADAEEEPKTSV